MRRQGELLTETIPAVQEARRRFDEANDGKDAEEASRVVEKNGRAALKHMKALRTQLTIYGQRPSLQGDPGHEPRNRSRKCQELAEKIFGT